MLELRAVGPRLLSKGHQIASPIEIAIVICRDVSDEVGGLFFKPGRSDWNLTPGSQPFKSTCRGTVAARGYLALLVDYRGSCDDCANPGGDPCVE